MAKVLVVADDLTGANAAAAGFSRSGLRAVTVGLGQRWDAIAEFHDRFDVIVATTESRHADPATAATAVAGAVRAGWPVELVAARIDTTLRGNVGVATEALLRTATELTGLRVVGLCLPAHPQAGRQTVGGNQLLNGVRLEDTELARDARSPVRTSSVAEVLGSGTSLSTALLPLSTVTGSQTELIAAIRKALDEGADVLIGDALTEDHLDRIAAAAVESTGAAGSTVAAGDTIAGEAPAAGEVLWAGVDPGPGSLALARALGIRGSGNGGPLLAVSGSATELTRTQLQRLIEPGQVHVVRPVYAGSLPDVDRTVAALTEKLAVSGSGETVLLATVLDADDLRSLSPEEAEQLPRALGRIIRRTLQVAHVDGLYTTGGDITAAVLEEIGGRGIEIEDEVIPLAVAGEVVDGQWAGLPIVTKGGLVGDAGTAVACLDHLAHSAAQRSRWVRSAIPREPIYHQL